MPNIKPTKLKILEGNRGRRPLPKNEPEPKARAPKIPSDINKEARSTWKRLAPKLERIGLLTEADGDEFALLCQVRARIKQIHGLIEEKTPELTQMVFRKTQDKDGKDITYAELKQSAYAVMEKQYYDLFRKLAGDFGLSPKGRAGLSIGKDKTDDGADLLT